MSMAEDFLAERYYKGSEDWYDLLTRVATAHAKNDKEFQEYYNMINELRGVPSSPILMNSGTDLGFLSACNLIPVEDDLGQIFDAIKSAGMIQKTGGGVGFNFSKLRPKGDRISKTGGTSSGVSGFLFGFDACSKMVKQGGKRRGANMGILAMWHPDILQWINAKHVAGDIETFNLSVGINQALFHKASDGGTIEFINPRTKENFEGIDPLRSTKDKRFSIGSISASELLQRIAQEIWHNGEPGLLFWDNIQRGNNTPWLGNIQGLNPCGEVPLYNWESCCLGSINLYNHLKETSEGWKFDYEKISETTKTMTKFLNTVLDNNVYPFPQMKEAALLTRKIGIGIMGFADCLYRMGVEYGDRRCMHLINSVMGTIKTAAEEESENLAKKDGPYPAWKKGSPKRRNANLLSIAPTGSISFISGVSSGIEPAYKIAYMMQRKERPPMAVISRGFMDLMKDHADNNTDEILNGIIQNDKTPNELIEMGLLDSDKYAHVVTSMEVLPEIHIKVQAAFQKHIDLAISKTINLPYNTTVEEIKRLIRKAYDSGCKGVTMFREGCFREAFLTEMKCQSCSSTKVIKAEGCMKCLDCGSELCSVA
jgi:ribonucleoside-diphosphate reductase alpha chain